MLSALLAVGLGLASPGPLGRPPAAPQDEPQQVLWQRSLEDALALCEASGRALLVAVNTDAESASERIVGEVYRDPRFVAASRAFVCVLASPLRHTPRDHDGRGRRVVDPRFGEVTSGEAVALEPLVFERFLGGERIAPRHALVRDPGGAAEVLFDHFQLYDFEILIADLERAAQAAGGPLELEPQLAPGIELSRDAGERALQWDALAAARSSRQRARLEDLLARVPGGRLSEALRAIAAQGNAGSLDALRVVLARAAREGRVVQADLEQCARTLDLAGPLAYALWEQLLRLDDRPGRPGLGSEAQLLPLLARLQPELARLAPGAAIPAPDVAARGLRSFLLSFVAVGADGPGLELEQARAGLAALLDERESLAVLQSVAAAGGPFDGPSLLRFAARTRPPARAPVPAEPLRGEDELTARLAELEEAAQAGPDTELRLARGRAGLELARVRLAAGGSAADLLLEDALSDLQAVIAERPADVAVRLEAARAAFLLQRFDEQERLALGALAALERAAGGAQPAHAHDWPALAPADDLHTETLRWLGDASARLLAVRAGGAPGVEALGILRALRSLSLVAAGAESDGSDWVSLASCYGALGRRREELAAVWEGLAREPGSDALRAALRRVAVVAGRPELALEVSRELAQQQPDSAAALWYLGFAGLEDAEHLRRLQDPRGALERYAQADDAFLESVEREPAYAGSVRHYRARLALGQGFAHLLAGDQAGAARELERAIAIDPESASARDGLDREALDLLDGALEWRLAGASPVDALALGERLSELDPAAGRWLVAVADSELREALRAAGRAAPQDDTRAYLERAVEAARRALERAPADPAAVRALAQPLTVLAERELAGEHPDGARLADWLGEAAAVLARPGAQPGADLGALRAACEALREVLGEAAPVTRPGR